MARKKKHPEHINHERWLVSYADFITLLFAFFVVMFAVSQVDSKKVGRFTQSFSKAVGVDIFPQPGRGIMPGVSNGMPTADDDPSKTSALPAELDGLQQNLTKAEEGAPAAAAGVQVLQRRNELVLRLADGLLFESGTDALREPAVLVLQKLAVELKKRNVDIRVEGHTDPRPIRSGRFRSNWDLSTSRATAVVARLAAEGIASKRLSAAGYGEFHPIAPNTTDDGMRKNRRVDLIVSLTPKDAPETVLKDANDKPAPKDEAKDAGAEHTDRTDHGDHGDKGEHGDKTAHDEHAAKTEHAAAPEHGDKTDASVAPTATAMTEAERVEKLEKELNEVLEPAREKPAAPAVPAAPAHESHSEGHGTPQHPSADAHAKPSHESHDSKPTHHE